MTLEEKQNLLAKMAKIILEAEKEAPIINDHIQDEVWFRFDELGVGEDDQEKIFEGVAVLYKKVMEVLETAAQHPHYILKD